VQANLRGRGLNLATHQLPDRPALDQDASRTPAAAAESAGGRAAPAALLKKRLF